MNMLLKKTARRSWPSVAAVEYVSTYRSRDGAYQFEERVLTENGKRAVRASSSQRRFFLFFSGSVAASLEIPDAPQPASQ